MSTIINMLTYVDSDFRQIKNIINTNDIKCTFIHNEKLIDHPVKFNSIITGKAKMELLGFNVDEWRCSLKIPLTVGGHLTVGVNHNNMEITYVSYVSENGRVTPADEEFIPSIVEKYNKKRLKAFLDE